VCESLVNDRVRPENYGFNAQRNASIDDAPAREQAMAGHEFEGWRQPIFIGMGCLAFRGF
jgi:hypothetical protein